MGFFVASETQISGCVRGWDPPPPSPVLRINASETSCLLPKSISVHPGDQTRSSPVRPSPEAPTQRFSQRLVEPLIWVLSTGLPRDASARPKKVWHWIVHGPGNPRFDFHGLRCNHDFRPKWLVAAERDGLTRFWWSHRDQQVKYPLYGDSQGLWRTFLYIFFFRICLI